MTLRNIFTESLKFYRKKAGLSQQQLAEKCDIATNYLSEIERGQKFPSIELIERLSSALNIPAHLFFLDETKTVNKEIVINKRNKEFSENLLATVSEILKKFGFIE